MNQKVTMGNLLEVERVNAVEAVESNVFEIRTATSGRLGGNAKAGWPDLGSLADMVSQYATA